MQSPSPSPDPIDAEADALRDIIVRAAFNPNGTVEFAPRSASSRAALRAVRSRHLQIAASGIARVTPHGLHFAALSPLDRDSLSRYLVLQHERIQLIAALKLRPRDPGIIKRMDAIRRGLATAAWCLDPEHGLMRQEDLAITERQAQPRTGLH